MLASSHVPWPWKPQPMTHFSTQNGSFCVCHCSTGGRTVAFCSVANYLRFSHGTAPLSVSLDGCRLPRAVPHMLLGELMQTRSL